MESDPRMSPEALAERQARLEHEEEMERHAKLEREASEKRRAELEHKALLEQKALLEREAVRRLQEQRVREAELARLTAQQSREPHPVYDTLGGRDASRDRTASGDRDGIRVRHPGHEQDPMISRYPKRADTIKLSEEELKFESPWLRSIRGTPSPPPAE